ncbi:MAG: hypothetical protein SGILL_006803 [Bacillariaceae sp.]
MVTKKAEEREESDASSVEEEEQVEINDNDDGGCEDGEKMNDGDAIGRDSDSSDEEEEEEDVAAALFSGAGGNSRNQEDDVAEGESDQDDEADEAVTNPSSEGPFTFDLRNLLAISTDQLATSSLYKNNSSKQSREAEASISIPLDPSRNAVKVNEDFLLKQATTGCTQLVRSLWQLPTEQSDAGPLVSLPAYDEVQLPRALPPPPPRQETKWEKFAKAKGIALNKEKRSRKVFDEASGDWMYRHGYEKANKKDKEWPIMEVGANDDPFEDPWEKKREAKKARVDKNIESRMKNEERAGNLARGATNRVMKGKEKAYKIGKEAGRKDMQTPVGVPVDLKDSTGDAKLRGKSSTVAALSAVQRSTASLGKFDKMREDEPERRKTFSKMKKRKYESGTDKKVIASEGEKSMKILNAVMNGGGVAKEKAIRKGKLAHGETAYDYDYDDGLGASSFRKKKGRAGAGKMKKMTKKRLK